MDVAVLIVSYDSAPDLARCLAALSASTHRAFSVVIVENAGPGAYRRLCAAVPARLAAGQPVETILAGQNLGFAGGVNLALDAAPGAQAYWILNPDTEPYPEALAAMVERLAQGDCGVVGHDLVLPNGRLASRGGGRWERWSARAVSIDHGRLREPRPAPAETEALMTYAIGASMLVARDFISRVGRMREDYFLYCEEVEWMLRARPAEPVGYAPDALVLHAHGTATGGGGDMRGRSRLSTHLIERNRLLLTRDLFPGALALAIPLALAHLLFKYGKARAWRQAAYGLGGWWAGVLNRRGQPAWFQGLARAENP